MRHVELSVTRSRTESAGPPTAYTGGGVITEKKELTTVEFRSFANCCKTPGGVVMAGDNSAGFLMTDMTFSMIELQLHVAQNAVWAFELEHGCLPAINDAGDAAKVVDLAKEFEAKFSVLGEMGLMIDELVVARVAAHADIELQPVCAFLGGVCPKSARPDFVAIGKAFGFSGVVASRIP